MENRVHNASGRILKSSIISVNGINSNSDITKIRTWLELYGELLNDITEDSHFDPNPDSHKVGNGVYSVKMKIKKPIPNFLPPLGLKIRINYIGFVLLCPNCSKYTHKDTCYILLN